MTQPVQHQMARPESVTVITSSSFFTRGRAYTVTRWADGTPQVRNDSGSFTWLVDPRTWTPVPEPMTLARSQELLHARYRAERARQDG